MGKRKTGIDTLRVSIPFQNIDYDMDLFGLHEVDYHHDIFNLEFDRLRKKVNRLCVKGVHIHLSKHGYLLLTFSPSEIIYGGRNNFKMLSRSDFLKALRVVKRRLKRVGIGFQNDDARVSRIDLFFNVNLKKRLDSCDTCLRELSFARMKKFVYEGETSTSYYYGNRSNVVCVYDKGQEMLDKKKGRNKNRCQFFRDNKIRPGHTVRIELRRLNSQAVQTHFRNRSLSFFVENFRRLWKFSNNNVILDKILSVLELVEKQLGRKIELETLSYDPYRYLILILMILPHSRSPPNQIHISVACITPGLILDGFFLFPYMDDCRNPLWPRAFISLMFLSLDRSRFFSSELKSCRKA